MDYIHRKLGIIHTDLKPENVMLSATVRGPKRGMPASSTVKHCEAAPERERETLPTGTSIGAFVTNAFSCMVMCC